MKIRVKVGARNFYSMKTFGERLKSLRGKASQAAIAEALGIPQTTLSNYERNKNEPNFALLDRICSIFSVNVEWLLFGRGPIRSAPSGPESHACMDRNDSTVNRQVAEIKAELEQERQERRELSLENRHLWRENAELRERTARLEEQRDKSEHPSAGAA